ncbi:ornithine cyclodeaminase family protein [Streptomyces triticiradicis]|uniref:Ornithine cyclodeaminase family protein n=1 Tax=Streptomyces triticiradicis TaxID=2651189 RepID=A0A7J5DDF5_9ACTN|nr:ornithine cyclodeaminase family protein [Streptomyces triticiradicis]KAB1985891.1 ornithine cyclodeaminase family protein [Streptomyces triticiradicis]
MSEILFLDGARTRAALDPHRVLDAVATALVAIGRDEVSVPPRIAARTPHGLLGAMPGHVPGLGLAAKLVSVFADPGRPGRSSHRGLVALFDETDGRPLALMDAEPLTEIRTAATATLSARALARPDVTGVAVVGTGAQARAQIALLAAVDPGTPVAVAGRDPLRAGSAAALHPAGRIAENVEEAVRGAGTVFCCTGAVRPVIRRSWLAPGTHVSSVGGSHGPELDADTVRDAALFAEWPGAATTPPPSGAHELQDLPPGRRVTLLGQVLAGTRPGRRDDAELTVFKSTGHAALDVAAAHVADAVARAEGWGTRLTL